MGFNCPQDQTIIEIMFLLEISPFCWFFFLVRRRGGREVEGKGRGCIKTEGREDFKTHLILPFRSLLALSS